MSHRYLPHTSEDIRHMLGTCGVDSLDGLYADVPDGLRLARHYSLPDEMSEKEVRDFFDALGRKNRVMTCFAGAGYYHHYAPSLTRAKLSLMLCRYTCVNPPLISRKYPKAHCIIYLNTRA